MKMLIGGEKVGSSDGKLIPVFNPATGEQIDTLPSATKEDIERAIAVANEAKKEWAEVPLYERCNIIRRFADLLEEHKEELAWIICRDNGKSIKDCRAEVERMPALARGYAERANHLYTNALVDAQPGMEHDFFFSQRVPLGVVACVVSYNYPLSAYTQKVASSLVMGNAIIIKPATDSALTCIRATELLYEAGVPGNVAQLVTGRGSVMGNYLLDNPGINAISLTGSKEVGTSVAQNSGKYLHHVFMELGGNDAFIIFDDADIRAAVEEAVVKRASNAGQTCASPKRYLVQRGVVEQFTELLVEALKKVKVGDPTDPNTDVGCLITEEAAIDVENQVKHAVEQGAKCVLGGKRYDRTFFPMTVLTECTEAMDVATDEEIFGPVFTIIPFDTEEDAVRIANHSQYGLSGGVMSGDVNRGIRVATKMETGSFVVNGSGNWRPAELPFGGFKYSGLGREGISATLEAMSQLRTIIIRNVR